MTDRNPASARPEPTGKPLSGAARRALDEAALRRVEVSNSPAAPPERGRKSGPDPARYGDWENKGIASDF